MSEDIVVPVSATLLRLRRPPAGSAGYLAVVDVELVVAGLAIELRGWTVTPIPGPARLAVTAPYFNDFGRRRNAVELPVELSRAIVNLILAEFEATPYR